MALYGGQVRTEILAASAANAAWITAAMRGDVGVEQALDVLQAVTGLRTPEGAPLGVRVGIATGLVVCLRRYAASR